MKLWAAEWRSVNRLDGDTRHWIYGGDVVPRLFRTRAECREFIEAEFGYIRDREDLRREPHGWRMPRAVMVVVSVRAATSDRKEPR